VVRGPVDLALRVASALDRLGIPYVLGGSLASSILGEPRATADIDIAIRLRAEDLDQAADELGLRDLLERALEEAGSD